jgi:hypothetical protein
MELRWIETRVAELSENVAGLGSVARRKVSTLDQFCEPLAASGDQGRAG